MSLVNPLLLSIALLLMVAVGCRQSEHPELRRVTGTVIYQDEPVQNAVVSFHNDKAKRLASGQTDMDGKFSLTSFNLNDGALPGEHRVLVTKMEGENEDAPSLSMDEALNAERNKAKRPRHVLPKKYATKATSPLVLEVTDEGLVDVEIVLED